MNKAIIFILCINFFLIGVACAEETEIVGSDDAIIQNVCNGPFTWDEVRGGTSGVISVIDTGNTYYLLFSYDNIEEEEYLKISRYYVTFNTSSIAGTITDVRLEMYWNSPEYNNNDYANMQVFKSDHTGFTTENFNSYVDADGVNIYYNDEDSNLYIADINVSWVNTEGNTKLAILFDNDAEDEEPIDILEDGGQSFNGTNYRPVGQILSPKLIITYTATENSVPTKPVVVDIGGVDTNNSVVDDLTPSGNGTGSTDEDEDALYYCWLTIEHGRDFGTPDFNTTFSGTVDVLSLGNLVNATEYDTKLVVTDLADTNQSDVFNFTAQVLEETSCGDEECNGDETCETCEADCGECEPETSCGDEECNGDETCETCEADCGECTSGSSGSSSISSGIQVEMKSYPKTVEPKESFDIVYEIKTTNPLTVRTEIDIINDKNMSVFREESSMLVKKSAIINTSVVKGLEEGDYTIRIKVRNKTLGTYPIKVKDKEEVVISFSWLKGWIDTLKEFFKRF